MPPVDPNIVLPALLTALATILVSCCAGVAPIMVAIVTGAFAMRQAAQAKQATAAVKETVQGNSQRITDGQEWTNSRFEELHQQVNDCMDENQAMHNEHKEKLQEARDISEAHEAEIAALKKKLEMMEAGK